MGPAYPGRSGPIWAQRCDANRTHEGPLRSQAPPPSESHSANWQGPERPPNSVSGDTSGDAHRDDRATCPAQPHLNHPRGPAPRRKPRPCNRACALQARRRLPEALGGRFCLSGRPVLPARPGPGIDNHWAAAIQRGRERPAQGRANGRCAGSGQVHPPRCLRIARRRRAPAGTTFPRGRSGGRPRPPPAAAPCTVPAGLAGSRARRPGSGAGRGRGGAGAGPAGCQAGPGRAGCVGAAAGSVCARGGDMPGAAGAGRRARARERGSPPRRGAPRTKPGVGRGRSAGPPAVFARPARGRPCARNGLSSKGQRGAVTAGPEFRGEMTGGRPGGRERLHPSGRGEGEALGQGASLGPGASACLPVAARRGGGVRGLELT